MWKKGFKPFKYVYRTNPIDHWDNALVPSMEEEFRVLAYMPEEPRSETYINFTFQIQMMQH